MSEILKVLNKKNTELKSEKVELAASTKAVEFYKNAINKIDDVIKSYNKIDAEAKEQAKKYKAKLDKIVGMAESADRENDKRVSVRTEFAKPFKELGIDAWKNEQGKIVDDWDYDLKKKKEEFNSKVHTRNNAFNKMQ